MHNTFCLESLLDLFSYNHFREFTKMVCRDLKQRFISFSGPYVTDDNVRYIVDCIKANIEI